MIIITEYIILWLVGLLALKLLWFPQVRSITTNEVYALHAMLWPLSLYTLSVFITCWVMMCNKVTKEREIEKTEQLRVESVWRQNPKPKG